MLEKQASNFLTQLQCSSNYMWDVKNGLPVAPSAHTQLNTVLMDRLPGWHLCSAVISHDGQVYVVWINDPKSQWLKTAKIYHAHPRLAGPPKPALLTPGLTEQPPSWTLSVATHNSLDRTSHRASPSKEIKKCFSHDRGKGWKYWQLAVVATTVLIVMPDAISSILHQAYLTL